MPERPETEIYYDREGGEKKENSDIWTNRSIYVVPKYRDGYGEVSNYEYSTARDCETNMEADKTGEFDRIMEHTSNTKVSYCIRSVDKAGNVGKWSERYYIKIDKEEPKIEAKEEEQRVEESESKLLSSYFTTRVGQSGGRIQCKVGGESKSNVNELSAGESEVECSITNGVGIRAVDKTKIYRVMVAPNDCFAFDSSSGTITSYLCGKDNTNGKPYYPDVVIPLKINNINIVSIGYTAFHKKQINSVLLSSGLQEVVMHSFSANNLKELVIPDNIKKIGELAFGVNQISKLTLPRGYVDIGGGAFNGNYLSDDKAFIYARNSDGTENKSLLAGYGGIKHVDIVIPSNITEIKMYSFHLSGFVGSLKIPSTLKKIGYKAFSSNSITELILPSSYIDIDGGAFNKNNLSDDKAFIYERNTDGTENKKVLKNYGGSKSNITIPL